MVTKRKKPRILNVRLRIGEELHARIVEAAAKEKRSLNAELLQRLNNSFNLVSQTDFNLLTAGLLRDMGDLIRRAREADERAKKAEAKNAR